jgi:xylulokinase
VYAIGYDIGSSSIKAAFVDIKQNKEILSIRSPQEELTMIAHKPGWAEQDPEVWWEHVCKATKELITRSSIRPDEIKSIGISYQMHGLVVVDQNLEVLRPSIIWCDSRAVAIGEKAFQNIGTQECLTRHMNSPGNFTASKLAWIKTHEPEIYKKIYKAMLPGDYIAMKLTGQVKTTVSGLSEGILWDFRDEQPSKAILEAYDFNKEIIPEHSQSISLQGDTTAPAAQQTGLTEGIPVGYRAGDQPNNALSLGVLRPGQVAATGGTSGVVYGVIDHKKYDPLSRVNNFAHINYTAETPYVGVLLCINGTGIAYNHIRQITGSGLSYQQLEELAAKVDIGADGLSFLPFGNGAERMLGNQELGAQYHGLSFNQHGQGHYVRATLEGIAFSFVYGINIMKEMGLVLDEIIAGKDNMFQSTVFAQIISDLTGSTIRLVDTTGAVGAARASAVAIGAFSDIETAMEGIEYVKSYSPNQDTEQQMTAYKKWLDILTPQLN